MAEVLGQPLMPWQQQVADVGLELLEDGRPAYREVVFTVPRQSGKTTLILAWENQRALGWAQLSDRPQRIVYSAQTGKDAREKLVEDQFPILEPRRKLLGIRSLRIANGSEGIVWRNGSRLGLMGGTDSSGHGKTVDLAVKDELFKDVDFHRDQTLGPAMATRADAQLVTASTMGTDESVALNAAVEMGRAAVEADRRTGVAYFEWSADPEADPGDPEVWWRCMPALGRTITLEVISHEYESMVAKGALGEFRRAYLNLASVTDERVIPGVAWAAVCDPHVEAFGELFAVDVNPERTSSGIVAVGGGPVIEVVDYRPGVGWVADRCGELAARYGARFVLDKTGPAGSLAEDLLRRDVPLVELDARETQHACALFFDSVMAGALKVRQNGDLDAAVAGAAKRQAGDAWVWGRKSSRGDVSLLVAASVGLWALQNRPQMAVSVGFV